MAESPTTGLVELSVVVPVYGCRECLSELHRRLVLSLEALVGSFEILLVNDASPDGAWTVIEELAAQDHRVRGIDLSRNFGQHYALTAGLDRARGERTVVMDCDLQHPPEEIAVLYNKALEGHDVVIGRRAERRDAVSRRVASRLFSWVLGFLMGSSYDSRISNFSIVSRPVLLELRRLREQNRVYTSLLYWLGFDSTMVDFDHRERPLGRTSYGFSRLARFALENIVSHPGRPLRLTVGFGLLLAVGSALAGAWLSVRSLGWGSPVPGWAVVLVAVLLIGGLLLVSVGIVGLYVGRLFEQSRGRPLYVIRKTVNID